MNKKIDIFVNGQYICSTTKYKNLKDAKSNISNHSLYAGYDYLITRKFTKLPNGKITFKYSKE